MSKILKHSEVERDYFLHAELYDAGAASASLNPSQSPRRQDATNDDARRPKTQQRPREVAETDDGKGLVCSVCRIVDTDKAHYKSDFHRYNLKRVHAFGAEPVSEEAFEDQLSGTLQSMALDVEDYI